MGIQEKVSVIHRQQQLGLFLANHSSFHPPTPLSLWLAQSALRGTQNISVGIKQSVVYCEER